MTKANIQRTKAELKDPHAPLRIQSSHILERSRQQKTVQNDSFLIFLFILFPGATQKK